MKPQFLLVGKILVVNTIGKTDWLKTGYLSMLLF